MKARNLVLVSLAAFGVLALPATAHALLVKVSINFGPTITGPDDGTLIVTANPGDYLRITWALGTDTSIGRYDGLISGVDTTEISRFGASALELTGQGFDPCCNPNAPVPGEFGYFVSSDGAPTGFAGNGGELWRIDYVVTTAVTDAATDMTYTFQPGACRIFPRRLSGNVGNGRGQCVAARRRHSRAVHASPARVRSGGPRRLRQEASKLGISRRPSLPCTPS